jgi:hypothetical protein
VETGQLTGSEGPFGDPEGLLPLIERFRKDHSSPAHNAFVMMRFDETPQLRSILETIRHTLADYGIKAHRSDDHAYSEHSLSNIRTYMHGCGLGVAVFERIESDAHDPNIALEVGYMLALDKRVCLLRDITVRQLPADLAGSLYSDFDVGNIRKSVRIALRRWLEQRKPREGTR